MFDHEQVIQGQSQDSTWRPSTAVLNTYITAPEWNPVPCVRPQGSPCSSWKKLGAKEQQSKNYTLNKEVPRAFRTEGHLSTSLPMWDAESWLHPLWYPQPFGQRTEQGSFLSFKIVAFYSLS